MRYSRCQRCESRQSPKRTTDSPNGTRDPSTGGRRVLQPRMYRRRTRRDPLGDYGAMMRPPHFGSVLCNLYRSRTYALCWGIAISRSSATPPSIIQPGRVARFDALISNLECPNKGSATLRLPERYRLSPRGSRQSSVMRSPVALPPNLLGRIAPCGDAGSPTHSKGI